MHRFVPPSLTREEISWYYDQYMPDRSRRSDPRFSPLRAGNLGQLPPAFVGTVEDDLLREDAELYAARMRDNGGIIPSHVGLDGTIGGAEGRWWAGAYGWGFSPINPVTGRREDRNRIGWALAGFDNALLLTGD